MPIIWNFPKPTFPPNGNLNGTTFSLTTTHKDLQEQNQSQEFGYPGILLCSLVSTTSQRHTCLALDTSLFGPLHIDAKHGGTGRSCQLYFPHLLWPETICQTTGRETAAFTQTQNCTRWVGIFIDLRRATRHLASALSCRRPHSCQSIRHLSSRMHCVWDLVWNTPTQRTSGSVRHGLAVEIGTNDATSLGSTQSISNYGTGVVFVFRCRTNCSSRRAAQVLY